MNQALKELKRIYTEAYETDPVVRNGFDGMAKIFIDPLIHAIKNGEDLEPHKEKLKLLFGIIGRTYNPEFPK